VLALREPEPAEWLAITSSAERFAGVLAVILEEAPSIEARAGLLVAALLAGPVDELDAGPDQVAVWRGHQGLHGRRGSPLDEAIRAMVAAAPGRLSAIAIAERLGCSSNTVLHSLHACGAERSYGGWALRAAA
jgi:hypothetical protein